MPRINIVDLKNASEEVKNAVTEHKAQGYRITNEKLTLLHNVTAFNALEGQSYELDKELQRLIGKRAADFYEYAISLENDCVVCSTYFENLLKRNGIDDFEHFEFTEQENLLITYGRAIVNDHKDIPEELFEELQKQFTEEQIVVITTMGLFMIANNYFNDILQVNPEKSA